MSTDAFFTPEKLEDEPCDGCGVKPSRHMGHGSFSCEACYRSWWCPKCTYRLYANHVCVNRWQHAKNVREANKMMKELDMTRPELNATDFPSHLYATLDTDDLDDTEPPTIISRANEDTDGIDNGELVGVYELKRVVKKKVDHTFVDLKYGTGAPK